MARLPILLALGTALALPGAEAHAAIAPGAPGSTVLISGAPGSLDPLGVPVGSSYVGTDAVSADGRYVAFVSDSDDLSALDDDLSSQVYVRDLQTGAVTLASRASGPDGAPAAHGCASPSLSDDGRRVAFDCSDGLDPADANGSQDVYVRDLDAQTTTLVSRAGGLGAVGDADSYSPAISGNGQYVAFESEAKNLSNSDPDTASDIFRRRLGGSESTILITVPKGAGTPLRSYGPSISDDGDVVAFTSSSTGKWLQTDVDDTNNSADIYARRVSVDDSLLVSTTNGNASGLTTGGANGAAVSGDGAFVAYNSSAANTNTADTDTQDDVFRRALASTVVTLISRPTGGAGTSDGDSYGPSIDQDGSHVAFSTDATNLGDGDGDAGWDVHVRAVGAATTTLASRGPGAGGAKSTGVSEGVALSDDASTVVMTVSEDSGLLPGLGADAQRVFARRADDTVLVSVAPGGALRSMGGEGGVVGAGAISADGATVAFLSDADGLSDADDDRVTQAFVRDARTRATTLVSRADGAHGAPADKDVIAVVLSADGRRAAFVTQAALVAADVNGKADVYVRDLAAGTTVLASVGDDGAIGTQASGSPSLDADGSRVAFSSSAPNLADGDTTPTVDVHVRDLATGHTLLASADGAGHAGNGASRAPSLSADGTRVAFATQATNLTGADADVSQDVVVRDLAAQKTTLASRADGADGANATADADSPSLSADGTRVAFGTEAPNLDPTLPDAGAGADVVVRDLVAGTSRIASRQDGAGGAKLTVDAYDPVLSGDGGTVLFRVYDAALAPGLTSEEPSVLVSRELAGGRTRLAARPEDGRPLGNQYYTSGALSADGACVAFSAWGHDVVPGVNLDVAQVYLHAMGGAGHGCGTTDAKVGEPAPGPGPGTTPSAGKDRTAPRITGAKVSAKRFRVAKGATAKSAGAKATKKAKAKKKTPAGTTLSFSVSEAATTSIVLTRAEPGKRKGKACVKATKKLAKAKKCKRAVTRGTLTRKAGKAGAVKVAFTGRVGKRALPAGRYTATLVATDAAGNRSKAVAVTFTIVR